jgi:hypothetical protein
MSSVVNLWRRKLKVWLPPAILFAVNLGFLSTYRLLLAGQAELLTRRVERLSAEVEQLAEERTALEETVTGMNLNRQRIDELYSSWLSTERQRLTHVIAEVKDLARRAGVTEPATVSYPEESLEEFGLVRRSLVFSVAGGYSELRQFINFVELSDLFLILAEVSLGEGGGNDSLLRISLRIETLFTEEELQESKGEPVVREG